MLNDCCYYSFAILFMIHWFSILSTLYKEDPETYWKVVAML